MQQNLGCGPNLKRKIVRFRAEIAFQTPGRYGWEIAAQRKTAQSRNSPAVLDVAEKGGATLRALTTRAFRGMWTNVYAAAARRVRGN